MNFYIKTKNKCSTIISRKYKKKLEEMPLIGKASVREFNSHRAAIQSTNILLSILLYFLMYSDKWKK